MVGWRTVLGLTWGDVGGKAMLSYAVAEEEELVHGG